MTPEYAFDGKFSVKSDIFSMGVVLLEIVTGKKNRSFRYMDHCDSLLGHVSSASKLNFTFICSFWYFINISLLVFLRATKLI